MFKGFSGCSRQKVLVKENRSALQFHFTVKRASLICAGSRNSVKRPRRKCLSLAKYCSAIFIQSYFRIKKSKIAFSNNKSIGFCTNPLAFSKTLCWRIFAELSKNDFRKQFLSSPNHRDVFTEIVNIVFYENCAEYSIFIFYHNNVF